VCVCVCVCGVCVCVCVCVVCVCVCVHMRVCGLSPELVFVASVPQEVLHFKVPAQPSLAAVPSEPVRCPMILEEKQLAIVHNGIPWTPTCPLCKIGVKIRCSRRVTCYALELPFWLLYHEVRIFSCVHILFPHIVLFAVAVQLELWVLSAGGQRAGEGSHHTALSVA
jgi:hypothetical protein